MPQRPQVHFTPTIAPRRQTDWDWRGACNFIFGGSGVGTVVAAAVLSFPGLPVSPLLLLGGGLIALGLLCVLAKIGRPLRALRVVSNPQTSWMTREALVALPLFAALAVAVLFAWPPLIALTALVAMVFLHCQAMILVASLGIPAWRTIRSHHVILLTALAEGWGLVLVLGPLLYGDFLTPLQTVANLALLLTVAGRVLTWRLYRRALGPGLAPRGTWAALENAEGPMTFVGHLLPLLLCLTSLILPTFGVLLGMVAGGLVVASGWYLKAVIVLRAGYTQGFALPLTPTRGGGKAGPAVRPGWQPAPDQDEEYQDEEYRR